MKTLKLLFFAAALISTQVKAGGNESYNTAYQQLNDQINNICNNLSEDEFNSISQSEFFVVTFSVNKRHVIENISVEGTNDKLAGYVEKVLNKGKIKVNSQLAGKKGQISIELPKNS